MSASSVTISVLTPTWNRSGYLERVWLGLASQTIKCFEWIISDDGSSDNTEEIVRALAKRSDFAVIYIKADIHVGKVRMDNEAILHAHGEFILWCDSDDYLVPHALARLLCVWDSIPQSISSNFVGITALAATNEGVVVNPFPNVDFLDVSWNDLSEVHGVTSDMLFFARGCALKENPFPEVDFVIPESVVWTAIGDQQARLIPEVLKIIEYNADHCISFSGGMAYNRGRAYALAASVRNLASYPRTWQISAWRLITFIRYCVHGELYFSDALRLWGDNSNTFLFCMATPFAWLLAIKDALQGKVVKSHREFLVAKGKVKIIVERLNNL